MRYAVAAQSSFVIRHSSFVTPIMLSDANLIDVSPYLVQPNERVDLKKRSTRYEDDQLDKTSSAELLEQGREHLAELQDKLYAHNRYGVLIILQAMDAAGKDGAVKHIMSGLNPQGVKVHSFKAPSAHELDHNYLWRHYIALPARGEIAIHNRSHYENVLIAKVHPSIVLNERMPNVEKEEQVDAKFWRSRYEQINRFEQNIAENGTVILKFFLHLSKDEQRKRFIERIDDRTKNWKFSLGDLSERAHWDKYQAAYEEALSHTSTPHAPWYVIPADNKWFTRLAIAAIIYRKVEELKLAYPTVSEEQRAALLRAKEQLLAEDGSSTKAAKEPKEKKKKK